MLSIVFYIQNIVSVELGLVQQAIQIFYVVALFSGEE